MSKNDKSSKENLTNTEDSTNKANNNSKNKVAENNSVTNSKINKEKNRPPITGVGMHTLLKILNLFLIKFPNKQSTIAKINVDTIFKSKLIIKIPPLCDNIVLSIIY